MYLTSHYTTVHMTAVSLALGIGGLAAVTLIAPSPKFHGYQAAFCGLWLASLLATAVAYAGTMIGSILLPPRLPAIIDLLLPLVLGMSEFLLFAILGLQAVGISFPMWGVFASWWSALGAFGFIAAASVWRAHYLVTHGAYASALNRIIEFYENSLRGDAVAAAATGLLGISLGTAHMIWGLLPTLVNDISVVVIVIALAAGLAKHRGTARKLRADLIKVLSEA